MKTSNKINLAIITSFLIGLFTDPAWGLFFIIVIFIKIKELQLKKEGKL